MSRHVFSVGTTLTFVLLLSLSLLINVHGQGGDSYLPPNITMIVASTSQPYMIVCVTNSSQLLGALSTAGGLPLSTSTLALLSGPNVTADSLVFIVQCPTQADILVVDSAFPLPQPLVIPQAVQLSSTAYIQTANLNKVHLLMPTANSLFVFIVCHADPSTDYQLSSSRSSDTTSSLLSISDTFVVGLTDFTCTEFDLDTGDTLSTAMLTVNILGVPTGAMTLTKVNSPKATGGAYFVGDTVQMNCSQPTFRGNPLAMTYAIYRASDGVTISSNDKANTSFSMLVSSLAYNSSYSCLARNALGKSPASLVPVLVLAPLNLESKSVSPQNLTVDASGQSAVSLQCVASGGGNLQATWYLQNIVIRPGIDVRYNVTTNVVQGVFAYNQSYATASTLLWTPSVLAQYICNNTNITTLYGGQYSCLFNDTVSGRQIKGNVSISIQGASKAGCPTTTARPTTIPTTTVLPTTKPTTTALPTTKPTTTVLPTTKPTTAVLLTTKPTTIIPTVTAQYTSALSTASPVTETSSTAVSTTTIVPSVAISASVIMTTISASVNTASISTSITTIASFDATSHITTANTSSPLVSMPSSGGGFSLLYLIAIIGGLFIIIIVIIVVAYIVSTRVAQKKTELQTHTTQFDNPNVAYWVVSAPDGKEKGGKGGKGDPLPSVTPTDPRFHDEAGSMRAHAEYHQLPFSSTDDILVDDLVVPPYNEEMTDPHHVHYQHALQKPQQPQYHELQHPMYADVDLKAHRQPTGSLPPSVRRSEMGAGDRYSMNSYLVPLGGVSSEYQTSSLTLRRATPGGGTALSFPHFSANNSLARPPDIATTSFRKVSSDLSNDQGPTRKSVSFDVDVETRL